MNWNVGYLPGRLDCRFLASLSRRFSFRDRSNVSPRTGLLSVICSTCRKASWLWSRFGTMEICLRNQAFRNMYFLYSKPTNTLRFYMTYIV
jgi:hypothetical protein